MKVAIVTSIYGDYDTLTVPVFQSGVQPEVSVEYICVTDPITWQWQQNMGPPWRLVVEDRPWLSPMMAAKVAKARPDLYTDAEVTIWVDGCIEITHRGFIAWIIQCLRQGNDAIIAMNEHTPSSSELMDEAESSKAINKYAPLPTVEQARHYISKGYPNGWGSWGGALIARRHDHANRIYNQILGDAWLTEMMRWGFQDQISLPYVLWKQGIRPANIPIPGFQFTYRGHKIQRCAIHHEPIGDERACIACDGGVF